MAGVDYSHPNCTVRREKGTTVEAGGASAGLLKFVAFQKMRVRKVKVYIATAGTANGGLDIYNGTTSIGTFATGTSTAGSLFTSADLAATVDTGGVFEVRSNSNYATGKCLIVAEYEVLQDAAFT